MQFRNRYLFCWILLLLLPVGAVSTNSQTFFFFVVTDSQLGMYDHDHDLSRETANLEKFVAVANRLHPAFVVNCGDSVNRAGDKREIEQFQQIMSALDSSIPVYNVAGNHDVHNQPTPASLAAYNSVFGRDYYTFQYEGLQGIVLNSSLIKYPELAPQEAVEQSEWLGKTLANAQKLKIQTVVFQHIPLFLHEMNEADNYSNLPRSNREKLLSQLSQAGVKYVFAGHLHDNAFGNEGKLQMRTVGPLGKPLGKAPSGFGIVVVHGQDLKFTYYSIDDPPAQVSM